MTARPVDRSNCVCVVQGNGPPTWAACQRPQGWARFQHHNLPHSVRLIIPMLALAATVACAGRATQRYAPTPFSADLLTWSELTSERSFDAYSAVERLRPMFFHIRPGASVVRGQPPLIRVFINGDYAGDTEVLRTIPTRDIESIRRLQPSMAYATLGAGYAGDEVLMVRLRCRIAC